MPLFVEANCFENYYYSVNDFDAFFNLYFKLSPDPRH